MGPALLAILGISFIGMMLFDDGSSSDDGQQIPEEIPPQEGTEAADDFVGTGSDEHIHSLGGDDDVRTFAGDDTIDAGAGNDSVRGGDGDDHLTGGIGDDTLRGGFGDDQILGGLGDDTLNGGAGNDVISDVSGFNEIFGGAGDDTITSDNSYVSGDDGNDVINYTGNDGYVHGGFGDDYITVGEVGGEDQGGFQTRASGSFGDDTLEAFGAHGVRLHGGAGDDLVLGSDGNDHLDAGSGSDTLDGGDGDDWLSGDSGTNVMSGGDGDDVIRGGGLASGVPGSDTMSGGAGDDLIIMSPTDVGTGGEGADTFEVPNKLFNGYGDEVDYMATEETAPLITDFDPSEDMLLVDIGDFDINKLSIEPDPDNPDNSVLFYEASDPDADNSGRVVVMEGVNAATLMADMSWLANLQ